MAAVSETPEGNELLYRMRYLNPLKKNWVRAVHKLGTPIEKSIESARGLASRLIGGGADGPSFELLRGSMLLQEFVESLNKQEWLTVTRMTIQ